MSPNPPQQIKEDSYELSLDEKVSLNNKVDNLLLMLLGNDSELMESMVGDQEDVTENMLSLQKNITTRINNTISYDN